jgi:ferredoxin-NADP reductase
VADAVGGCKDVEIYICGLWDMVREVRDMLTGMGLDRKRVIFERYD